MENNQGNFFDRKTILAVALTGVVFLGWQKYLSSKYPNYGKEKATTEVTQSRTDEKEATQDTRKPVESNSEKVQASPSPEQKSNYSKAESLINVETPEYSLDVSSRGLGIKNIVLKKYVGRDQKSVQLVNGVSDGLFELRSGGQPINFEVTSKDSAEGKSFIGVAQVGTAKITRTISLNSAYFLDSKVVVENANESIKDFEIIVPEKRYEFAAGNILSPATDYQEVVLKSDDKTDRFNTTSAKESEINGEGKEKSTRLNRGFGISTHYFATAFQDKSDVTPLVSADLKRKEVVQLSGVYHLTTVSPVMTFSGVGFFGPKDYKAFDAVQASSGQDFSYLVNFGYFGGIGKLLLKLLQFFYENIVSNWGVAIILLTVLVRLIVFPFNAMSIKSMKNMQKIQPQIAVLREKYKDNPQTLNAEMMQLMKEKKVNPLGGCLPMLLQMPVFFALYQVLGQSIELYQAPFFGWIQDLSLKDPYFITPILMGAAMWYNQKITPNTMDPAQAKVMQFMPVVFSLMMFGLPSGLTLYIFVSTIFGIAQQRILMRDNPAPATGGVIKTTGGKN